VVLASDPTPSGFCSYDLLKIFIKSQVIGFGDFEKSQTK